MTDEHRQQTTGGVTGGKPLRTALLLLRAVFVLAILFGAVGFCIAGSLVAFLLSGLEGTSVPLSTGFEDPPNIRCALGFGVCGAAVGFGAFLWAGFSTMSHYVKRILVLSGVAGVAILASSFLYHVQYERAAKVVPALAPSISSSNVLLSSMPLGTIPLA